MTEESQAYEPNAAFARRIAQRVLDQLADDAASQPDTMASLLKLYAQHEGIFTDDRLAERLGIDRLQLRRLRLCLRPERDSQLFAKHVQQIAAYVGMDTTLLANLVRQVDAITAMQEAGKQRQIAPDANTATRGKSAFGVSAARDRIAGEPPEVRETSAAYPAVPASPLLQSSEPAPGETTEEATEQDGGTDSPTDAQTPPTTTTT